MAAVQGDAGILGPVSSWTLFGSWIGEGCNADRMVFGVMLNDKAETIECTISSVTLAVRCMQRTRHQ
jgi:hypothetical protein